MIDIYPKDHMTLVEINRPNYDIDIDIVYATEKNFTGAPVYGRPGCYLHPTAAKHLTEAIILAAQQKLKFRIFDAFRPAEAQLKLWKHTPDPEFLANPRRGSPHSRAVAVDLTLINETGTALDMGTHFDAFTPLSHHGNTEVTATAQRNRQLLLGIMTTAGWDFYRNEWWHYQLFDSQSYRLHNDDILSEPMMS